MNRKGNAPEAILARRKECDCGAVPEPASEKHAQKTKGQVVRPALRLKAQAYDLGVSVRRRGCGFGLFPTGALDAGGFAPQGAEVVQARTAHVAFAHDVNGRDRRRVQRENAFEDRKSTRLN